MRGIALVTLTSILSHQGRGGNRNPLSGHRIIRSWGQTASVSAGVASRTNCNAGLEGGDENLQDRHRIDRGTGAADHYQGIDGEQELVAALLGAGLGQGLEQGVVQQRDAVGGD